MSKLDDALSALELRKGEALPILERWVTQNSYSADAAGVNAMLDLLLADFELPGLRAERRASQSGGDHAVWRTEAFERAAPAERIVLVGHHDTVFPKGSFDVWKLEGEILRGPGVYDMKGGLVAVRCALAALADCGVLSSMPIALVSVGDEEIGSRDSAPFIQEVASGAGAALVFESGRAGDRIVTQRKGSANMIAVARGVAAHAGNHHEQGINAIWALAQFIDRAQRITDYESGVTLNVGLIKGGEARNTVPASAECTVDIRFIRRAEGEAAVARVREHAAAIDVPGASIELEGGINRLPLERTEASLALLARYARAAAASGLGCEENPLVGGGSDANTVSAVGVPAIDGLGPRGGHFHTHDEYIEVPTLALRAQALVRFLCAECGMD